MAGRNTSKFEHVSRMGGIVDDYHLTDEDVSKLSKFIKCKIEADKRSSLNNLITIYRTNKRPSDINIQDVKRTLLAMNKLDTIEAIYAYENCDIHTECSILREIYLMEKEGKSFNIKEAISRAQNNLSKLSLKGGRPEKLFIQEFICRCMYGSHVLIDQSLILLMTMNAQSNTKNIFTKESLPIL